MFANNPLTVDDEDFNYSDLKAHVQNILFDHHASSYSLCVLYDMEDQKQDPIKCSIASNIHEIKENIREKLYALGIAHVTLELEKKDEHCHEKECKVEFHTHSCHHHHHHH